MNLIRYSDIKNLDEYKEYKRQRSKLWYEKNKLKKKLYQKNYYIEKKKEK